MIAQKPKYYSLIVLFFGVIILINSCKKEPIKEKEEPVKEVWHKIPSSEIYLRSRSVLAIKQIDTLLYIQVENMYYKVTKNFKRFENPFYGGPMNKLFWRNRPRIGKTHTIFSDHRYSKSSTSIKVIDHKESGSQYNLSLNLKNLDPDIEELVFSPVENNAFKVLYAKRVSNQNVQYYIKDFKLLDPFRNPSVYKIVNTQKIKVVETLNPRIFNYNYYYFNDFSFCNIGGYTYRIDQFNKTDTIYHNIKEIVKIKNTLFANSAYVGYFKTKTRPELQRDGGLLKSTDNGKTWNNIGKGGLFNGGILKKAGDKLFVSTGNQLVYIDFKNSTTKTINLDGVDAYIRDIAKFNDKLILGTDAGVYYKDWDSVFE